MNRIQLLCLVWPPPLWYAGELSAFQCSVASHISFHVREMFVCFHYCVDRDLSPIVQWWKHLWWSFYADLLCCPSHTVSSEMSTVLSVIARVMHWNSGPIDVTVGVSQTLLAHGLHPCCYSVYGWVLFNPSEIYKCCDVCLTPHIIWYLA